MTAVTPIHRGRERIEEKAARLLAAGKVTVCYRVQGDNAVYLVRRHGRGWSCTCPSRRDCSHKIAARMLSGEGA